VTYSILVYVRYNRIR